MNDGKFFEEEEEEEEEEATVWKGNPCLLSSERHVYLPKGPNPNYHYHHH